MANNITAVYLRAMHRLNIFVIKKCIDATLLAELTDVIFLNYQAALESIIKPEKMASLLCCVIYCHTNWVIRKDNIRLFYPSY